jgi:cell division transport system permease protein
MRWPTLHYLFKQTILGIQRNPWNHAVTTITVALAVLIFSVFLLLLYNIEQFLDRWQAGAEVTVYLAPDLPVPKQKEIIGLIATLKGVEKAEWISAEEALRRFRTELGQDASILEGLAKNPLPASIELRVAKEVAGSPEEMDHLIERLYTIKGVETIQSGQEWVERLALLRRGLTVAGWILGGGLLVAVVFIISNTIKLTVYARKEEIEIMRLVGATDGFIRTPFVFEGIAQGLAGTALAVVVLVVGFQSAAPFWNENLQGLLLGLDITFLPFTWVGALLTGGLAVGGLASFLSLARFLQ